MENTNDVLNAAKAATGLDSDSKLAKKIGVSPQALNQWRQGTSHPDSYAVVQLAKLLNRSPLEILGIVEAGKAKTEERKEYWQDFLSGLLDTSKKLGVIGAITCASFTATTPRADAQPTTLKAEAGMYIMLKRLLRRALGKRLTTSHI